MIARPIKVATCALFASALSALLICPVEADPSPLSGMASVYSYEGDSGPGGDNTASGEKPPPTDFTAAHRTLPFGTRVRVTNKRNGKSVVVRINDRGPFIKGRVIDISPGAARVLGFSGLVPVTLSIVN